MSAASVRDFLRRHAPDIELIEAGTSLATVDEAASTLGVVPGQIAKTMALDLGAEVILVVMGGDARLDNRRFRERFGVKPRLLDMAAVERTTGHAIGGVSPVGLSSPLRVFCDTSLRRHAAIFPAGGACDVAFRISPVHLQQIADAEWIDVAKAPAMIDAGQPG